MLFDIRGIVQRYIERIIQHEADRFKMDVGRIDLIIRKRGELTIYVYDTAEKKTLRTLNADDIKNILT